ncbi:MAG: hypothetical protein AAFX40_06465 [Cyanobacteria bacterium J06639_1]
MLFVHPMWHHESQRVGKQKCTPLGYALHVIAELIGWAGGLMFFLAIANLIVAAIANRFHVALLGVLLMSLLLGVISEGLYRLSWYLARRKGFCFDYERCEASWIEAGQQRTYKYPSEPQNLD